MIALAFLWAFGWLTIYGVILGGLLVCLLYTTRQKGFSKFYGHLRIDGNVKGLIDNDIEVTYMGLKREENVL